MTARAATRYAALPPRSHLIAYNLLLLAHAWALKHWYFEHAKTLDSYIRSQRALALWAVLTKGLECEYQDLLACD